MVGFDPFFNAEISKFDFYKKNNITPNLPIIYKNNLLIRYEEFYFEDGEKIAINIESTDSEWRQGIRLDIFGCFEFDDGFQAKDRIVLWADTCPKHLILKLWKEPKKRYHSKRLPPKGFISFNNAWDHGDGSTNGWNWGAAMKVEEIENGRRYHCSDGKPDANFNNIVFTVKMLKPCTTKDWQGSLDDPTLPRYE